MEEEFKLNKIITHLEENEEKMVSCCPQIASLTVFPYIELMRDVHYFVGRAQERFLVRIGSDNEKYSYTLSPELNERARILLKNAYMKLIEEEKKKKEEVLNKTLLIINNVK